MCKALVRKFLKSIKGHYGYFACKRCTVERIYYKKGVRLLFAQHCYNEHHDGSHQKAVLSPLVALNFPMVTGFALVAMHLVYLEIV